MNVLIQNPIVFETKNYYQLVIQCNFIPSKDDKELSLWQTMENCMLLNP